MRIESPYEDVHITRVASLEVIAQGPSKSFGGAAAAGLAGGFLLGGVGALAGVLAGGNGTQVTFQLTLSDGRNLIGSASPQVFQALKAVKLLHAGREPAENRAQQPLEIVAETGIARTVGVAAIILTAVYFGMTALTTHVFP